MGSRDSNKIRGEGREDHEAIEEATTICLSASVRRP